MKFHQWGLGIGDWGLGIGPNPPIPNPQSPLMKLFKKHIFKTYNYKHQLKFINKNYQINFYFI
jgi:hypothetical protein